MFKKTIFLMLPALFLSASLLGFQTQKASASSETEIHLTSCEDAYVAGGEKADLNFGLASPIIVRKHEDSAKNDSQGYIKFSIPSGVTSVSKATFDIGLQSPNPTTKDNTFSLYTTSSGWNEGEGKAAGATVDYTVNPTHITYNNIPSLFPANQSPVVFETTAGVARDGRYTVDVTKLVNDYIATFEDTTVANYISFCISSTVNKGESTSFQSKNYAGKEPKLTIVTGEFEDNHNSEEIYEGLTYTTERVLNSSKVPVNMFTMEVDSNSSLAFYTGLPDDSVPLEVGKRATASEQAKAAENNGKNVVAGINADFFNASNDAAIQPRGLVIRDGVEYHPEYNGAMFFGVLKNGDPIIGGADEYYANKGNFDMAVGADIGYLVKNGVPCATNEEAGEHAEGTVNPRTAIGIKSDKSVVMVVCDGRTADSNGMVLTDLAKYMVSKGCITAVNLDGGWSSTMVKKNYETGEFDSCNYPSNGGVQRPLGETILVIDTEEKTPATKEMVTEFVDTYMHMDDIDVDDPGTGLCLGDTGYYNVAKQALLNLESKHSGAIKIFATDADFLDAYNRMRSWATANGEVFNADGFISKTNIVIVNSNNTYVLVIICSAVLIGALFSIAMYKKRKIND